MRRPERRAWGAACWLAVLLAGSLLTWPAAAGEALTCAPRTARQVESLPAAQRHGLLWEVRAPNGAVGHLLGTIHLALTEVTTLSPQLVRLLGQSERFGMEVIFDAPTLTRLARSMWAADGEGLQAVVTDPVLYARTLALLATYGIDENAARMLKPWAAYTTLSLPPAQDGPPLDLKLMQLAQGAGKPLFGVESLDEQMDIFETMSKADQLALLRETVCHYAAQQQDMRKLVAAYARSDLASLHREALRWESAAQSRLMEALLDDRNARMAERLQPRFDETGTFAAVGALHLPGPGGLLERLTAAGYTLRALE